MMMEERRRSPCEPSPDPVQGSLPGAFRLGYPLMRGRWDEMVTAEGALRPQWERLMGTLSNLPPGEMEHRWERGQRLIRENGVTYNVYGDPRGIDRPWQLDPLPMMISAQEWRSIETAVIQRATLLNHVLADLYGPQELLSEGLLPPALVFSHPGYLRPLRHVQPPGGVHLHLYAVDLARAANGKWWAMSDRCEAPSGAGYALENRIIIARSLSDMLRAQPVEPLTPFFHKLRDTLMALSPRNREAPRTVLLTPGPYNETYFEHAYLARQLGYTLVESEDLTMRDGRVYLKTLDGLQGVDVILRRTDGAYCDPLELRGDSSLGIAGLVQAVRAGNVLVANSLGTGVLESGSLAAFLPVLSRHLLGEELKMPSVATWWCGGDRERQHVLKNLDDLVIKSALPGRRNMQPVFGDQLPPARRAELIEAIRRRPRDFLAQERVNLSTAPVWNQGELEPRPMMIRVYVAAHDGDYTVMPGGLTRIASERGGSVVSMQFGGGSKDTWVVAEQRDAPAVNLRNVAAPVKLVRGSRDLPSRVADNMYWMGRYIERAEDTTRLIRACLSRAGSAASYGAAEELPVAVKLLNKIYRLKPKGSLEAQVAALTDLHFDNTNTTGLRTIIERVHRMAALARDRLSPDTWRAVARLQQEIAGIAAGPGLNLDDGLNVLNNLVLATGALSGLATENMTRGLGWRFVDIGRRLERGVHILDLLSGVLLQKDADLAPALDVLLEISDSTMTYRSRYLSTPQFGPVLDLLLADESNPRSLAFQLVALSNHVDHLAASRRAVFFGSDQRLTIWLTGAVRTADIEVLAQPDEDEDRRALATFFETLRSKLWELSETVTREYFTHAVSRSSSTTLMREPLP
jgi:uncharacterized circularly permuted ATP-grasp superfamily protein/uncharacterized alpha-E superfamily protein